ncbi:hypothetical protein ACFXA8_37100, partial [Streptomyces sp. NPDC059409]
VWPTHPAGGGGDPARLAGPPKPAPAAVAEVAVVGLPDERWIEAVTAVVVPRGEVTEDELIAHARERLTAFKAPKRVRFVDALPRNASGKILKRELRDRFAGS